MPPSIGTSHVVPPQCDGAVRINLVPSWVTVQPVEVVDPHRHRTTPTGCATGFSPAPADLLHIGLGRHGLVRGILIEIELQNCRDTTDFGRDYYSDGSVLLTCMPRPDVDYTAYTDALCDAGGEPCRSPADDVGVACSSSCGSRSGNNSRLQVGMHLMIAPRRFPSRHAAGAVLRALRPSRLPSGTPPHHGRERRSPTSTKHD
jgi:hypothetical protein